MFIQRSRGLAIALSFILAGCAVPDKRPLVDPFPLKFPLVEAGSIEIEGHIVGQPRARDGIIYFATREGYLTAAVISSRSILWRRIGQENADGPTPQPLWEGQKLQTLRSERSQLQAYDAENKLIWEFAAAGTITAEPSVLSGRVYFGTESKRFYCLSAATGKTVWSRRLQGSPLHPAIVSGGAIAVPASNSVVYRLSRRGGSILSWEAVPSRIVYELAAAGSLILISSASPTVMALDLRTGKRAGQYEAPGPLIAGAVWSPPYVVLFVEDEESGRQRLVFLKPKPGTSSSSVEKPPRKP